MEVDVHDSQKIGMTTRNQKASFSTELLASGLVVVCDVTIQFEDEFSSLLGMDNPEDLSLIVRAKQCEDEIRADSRRRGILMPFIAWFRAANRHIPIGARALLRQPEGRMPRRDIALAWRGEEIAWLVQGCELIQHHRLFDMVILQAAFEDIILTDIRKEPRDVGLSRVE
jgi:hypothetical protein